MSEVRRCAIAELQRAASAADCRTQEAVVAERQRVEVSLQGASREADPQQVRLNRFFFFFYRGKISIFNFDC